MSFTYGYMGIKRDNPRCIYYNLINGALAGTAAVTLTYPTDLVRKLMQLNGSSDYHKYDGLGDAIKIHYQRYGVPGFYKGIIATYYKVAPMVAILFLTNE